MPEPDETLDAPAYEPPKPKLRLRHGLLIAFLGLSCAAVVAAFFMVPSWLRKRESTNRTICMYGNLGAIARACQRYAQDHNGAYPQELGELCPNYLEHPRLFSCPSKPSKWKEAAGPGPFTRETTSYVYVSGVRRDDPGNCVLAFDRPGNHGGGGGSVVFAAGHVTWMNRLDLHEPGELNELLDQTREAVRKRGGEIKLVGE